MADPTTYTPEFNFSGYQATSPADPLPGPSLDNEFDNIETAIDGLVGSLKNLRRSDGRLVNQIVNFDALAPEVLVAIARGGPIPQVFDASTLSVAVFSDGATTALGLRFAKVIGLRSDAGAIGDNITDDTAAIQKAINMAGEGTIPIAIDLEGGYYHFTGQITVRKSVVFISSSVRQGVFTPSTGGVAFTFQGTQAGGRCANSGFRNVQINCLNQPADSLAIDIDFAQDFEFDGILTNAYNGMRVRQTGGIRFSNKAIIDATRGAYSFLAYGPTGTRNGQADRVDVIDFGAMTMQGTYVPGVTAPASEMVVLDGLVHTIVGKLRLLSCNRGMRTTNSYGTAREFSPSFIWLDVLEVENTFLEAARFEWANSIIIPHVFSASTIGENGIYLGANVNEVRMTGMATSAWKHGVEIAGATNVTLDYDCYYNGQASAGFAGVHILSGDNVRLFGGKLGKNTGNSAYTDPQSYGIWNEGGTNVALFGTDLRNNLSQPFLGAGMNFYNCPGVLGGADTPYTLTASPTNFPALSRIRFLCLYGGTGVIPVVGGQIAANATPCTIPIPPGITASVTYTTAPIACMITL